MTTAGVILSHSDNECTSFPFWAIVKKCNSGQMHMLAGVWFNREDAERFLNATHHRYGDKAFVYCFSGHDSWHIKELYNIARKEAGAVAP